MPGLKAHMLRVAGVASIICDNFSRPVDKNLVISAALLHDIGNIVKFKLEAFPGLLDAKDMNYWTRVQEDFKKKYGENDYQATYKILKEIGVSKAVSSLIEAMEVTRAPLNVGGDGFEVKICQYADLRVAPFGVLPLKDRLREVQDRFIKNKGISEQEFLRLVRSMEEIEKQIFVYEKISPNFVTDEKIASLTQELDNFDIATK